MTTKVPAELSSTPSIVDNGNATAMTIDSSEQIGIGTTAPNDYDNNAAGISSNLVVKDSGHSGIIVISGASSDAAISFGDGTGTAAYRGAVAYVNSADALYFKAGGNNKLRLDSDGLKFGLDTAAANALDDYEEGTWSPTLVAEAGSTGQSYDRQYGYYTRIGDFVFLTFDVRVTNVGTSGAGQVLTLGNHGFTFTGNNTGGMGLCGWFNLPNLGTNQVNFYANGSYIYPMEGSTTYIDVANHLTTNSRLIGGFCGQINR